MPIKKKKKRGYAWYQSSLENMEVVKEMPVKHDGGTVKSQKNPGRRHFWEFSALQGLACIAFMDSVFRQGSVGTVVCTEQAGWSSGDLSHCFRERQNGTQLKTLQ